MKIVIFGLTVSSSWGNGHATLWRGLIRALVRRGHRVVFFEQDVPYYAAEPRPARAAAGRTSSSIRTGTASPAQAKRDVGDADVAIVTSYCPHALEAERLLCDTPRALRVFYDLDTPVTLASARRRAAARLCRPERLRGL